MIEIIDMPVGYCIRHTGQFAYTVVFYAYGAIIDAHMFLHRFESTLYLERLTDALL